MKIKIFFTFILLVLSLYSQGQPIQKSGKSDTEKKIENYIIDKTNPKYYHSIEFGEKKVFDLNQLIKDFEIPTIFSDESEEIKKNKEAFKWLKTFNNETNIAYSITLTFGLKEKKTDAWNPYWIILLLNSETNIIGDFYYAP